MAWYKKLWNGIKKVGKYVAPAAAIAAPFIPGVGGAISGLVSKVGGALGIGGSSAQSNAPPNPNQVQVTGQRSPDWFGMAAQALPPLLNYFGQKDTNVANAQQAQRQMDFQAGQTGSSYQRGVADMKAAGLNPMLAYSQGGASSGGGAQATMGNELGAGANSALSTAMTLGQLNQMHAQVENIQAQTDNTNQHTKNLESENLFTLAKTTTEGSRSHETAQNAARIALANQLASATQSSNIRLASSTADLRRSEAEKESYLAKASKYDLSRAGAWSKFFDSSVGQAYPYTSTIAETANSAAGALGKLNPFKFGR